MSLAHTASEPGPSTAENTTDGAMRALVKHHAGEGLRYVDDRPVPAIGPRDVRIRVTTAGICGTDRHIWQWDDWAAGRIPVGIVTGHEFVGVIDAVGDAVRKYEPGQRVSAEGHLCSGTDYNARTGAAHIAVDTQIIGIDRDGCFADYVVVPEENVWPVHPDIPDAYAAVFDPLGNAVHTVMEAGVSAKSVLISGVGIIGLMAVTVAKAAGAARIFCTDVNPGRLALARELGADEAFDVREGADWIDHVRTSTPGGGADVLLEMSGFDEAIDQGFHALRMGGTAALLGLPAKRVNFDFNSNIIFKGCTVFGINGRRIWETWYQSEALLLSGRLKLDKVITHRFPLEKYEEAFATMISGEGIKVLLDVS